jgi:hypothetical protein
MKTRAAIAMAVTILACGTALAADMPGMKLDKPAGTAMEKQRTHHAAGMTFRVQLTVWRASLTAGSAGQGLSTEGGSAGRVV